MIRRYALRSLVSVLSFAALGGCASVPAKGGLSDVQNHVSERTGQSLHWTVGTAEDQLVAEKVALMLDEPLTLPTVIQVALLNNPDIQALYEELGIAQSDLVQAGLLENPVFSASVRLPDHDRSSNTTDTLTFQPGEGFSASRSSESSAIRNNIEFAVVQSFLDLLMLPIRKRLAEAHFEETKLRVSHEVLRFAGEVKLAYYDYVSAIQVAELMGSVNAAANAASEFATRQYEAGNLSRLSMSRENAFLADTMLEQANAELAARLARETLSRMMGVWADSHRWRLSSTRLDSPTFSPFSIAELEPYAIANRLDLAASVQELETLVYTEKVTRKWRWLGLLDVSVSTERDGDGVYVTGPALELQLPIFDQGQAKLALAESDLRAGKQRISSLAIVVRSRTRQAVDRVNTALEAVDFCERVLLPVHERIIDESQLHYNAMLIGMYDLLLDKQQQIEAGRTYIEALRDYWIAHTELEMAVGGMLPEAQANRLVVTPAEGMKQETVDEATPHPAHNH